MIAQELPLAIHTNDRNGSMQTIRTAFLATTITGVMLVGIPSASASSGYTLDHTNKASVGSCTVWQDVVYSTVNDDREQHGHGWSANNHQCMYEQMIYTPGAGWSTDYSDRWTSGNSAWSPLAYDGIGYFVQGCVWDYTINSDAACTKEE